MITFQGLFFIAGYHLPFVHCLTALYILKIKVLISYSHRVVYSFMGTSQVCLVDKIWMKYFLCLYINWIWADPLTTFHHDEFDHQDESQNLDRAPFLTTIPLCIYGHHSSGILIYVISEMLNIINAYYNLICH
jgi:hypothetical protein